MRNKVTMIYFDLESRNGTLYKLEAVAFEGAVVKDNFLMISNQEMPDALRKITGITKEQTEKGTDPQQIILNFWEFLHQNQAVKPFQIKITDKIYYQISCIGFAVCEELQKIFLRYNFRVVYNKSEYFCGDLYEFAIQYCNHLPIKHFMLRTLEKYFSIQQTGLFALPALQQNLEREAKRPITDEECNRLADRLKLLDENTMNIPRFSERISWDLFRILTVNKNLFANTILMMFERTKGNLYAESDWRRIIAQIEKHIVTSHDNRLLQEFETVLPSQIQEIYPLSLTYKVLDGENRIGANLIEISYRKTKLLIECGIELEHTIQGEKIRKNILNSHYDACLISHYHADHAGLIDKIEKRTTVYIGETTKRILQTTNKKQYSHVKAFSESFKIDEITITPYLCDHSAMDSYMFRFSAGGKSILYTGDFRGHGRKSFSALLERLPHSDILICEHTNNSSMRQWRETELQGKFEELMRDQSNIFIFVSTTNIDRIVTIYKACRKMRRILLIDYTQARILDTIGGSIPHPRSHQGIKVVRFEELKKSIHSLSPFVMLIRTSMADKLNDLLDKNSNALMIYSMWSGYREKDDVMRLIETFNRHNCPIYTLHTSGHADSNAIESLIKVVAPQETVFVHGED